MKKITFEDLLELDLGIFSDVKHSINRANLIVEILEKADRPMTCTEIVCAGPTFYYGAPILTVQEVASKLRWLCQLGVTNRKEVKIDNPYSFTVETNKHNLYYKDGTFAKYDRTWDYRKIDIKVDTKTVYFLA